MKKLKQLLKGLPIINKYVLGKRVFMYYKNEHSDERMFDFIIHNFWQFRIIRRNTNKTNQISTLIKRVKIYAVDNASFFYSIDPFVRLDMMYQILDNYSIDYTWVVESSFKSIINCSKRKDSTTKLVRVLREYVDRLKGDSSFNNKYKTNINEIDSLFDRPAIHLHEAIQRILFVNQWLWQSGHKHNGFGHLDWMLYDLYKKDLESGYITKDDAKQYLRDLFLVLHDKCWFKSTLLLGDTGQIIILGGLEKDGRYHCNELTYMFIEISKELKLPDPKVLLRVSNNMPDDLLLHAMECISTGIGAPLLSNDDRVIPALIQFGYEEDDAYNYATSACWEPLTLGKSCDQNNIRTVNFCEPFVRFIDSPEFEKCETFKRVKEGYYKALQSYLNNFLSENLDNKLFEEDPLLTLFSPEVIKTGKDIVRGGAKYSNLGVTSVGMSTVVNSLLNLKHYVFDDKAYSLYELNKMRQSNFENNENVRTLLNMGVDSFGHDNEAVIELTKEIMLVISRVLESHHTKLGGSYKYGLSSPNYIVDSKEMGATFDGRKEGEPFGVHISGKNGLSPTELISFASQLDYTGNRINGNVIDFILSPGFINSNLNKAVSLIKGGIRQGFYQLQINVVDSKSLIEAQKNPELFPNLVVRVWGFSAYFKDLPKEYQDNLIKRAIEAEMAA